MKRGSATSTTTLSGNTVVARSTGAVKELSPLWIHSVSEDSEFLDGASGRTLKLQEVINELIDTECDFVQDLEYIRDCWMKPLRTGDTIPAERREDFVKQVFWNVEDILEVNTRLRDLLIRRRNAYPIVETIGDIFLELVPHFHPFVQYGKHQLYGKHEFEKEKALNPAFAAFVETAERLPESRKLELNRYLSKPTTRLARYPLLLEVVLEDTLDDNADKVEIPKVIKMVREFLAKVKEESGRTENRLNLLQLDKELVFRPGEEVDLRLKDEQRQLVYKGPLKRRGGAANENRILQIFLFDHALLMAKSRVVNKHEQLKAFKRPIPLELLVVSTPEEYGYQLTLSYLGKKGYTVTLWAPTPVERKKWVEHIIYQQEAICERSMVFDTYMLSEGAFLGNAKVNCAVPYDYGRRFAYGTDHGVYFKCLYAGVGKPERKLPLKDVQQIEILEDYQLVIVLAEQKVLTFPLDLIDTKDPLKRTKRIASHTSFFKTGYCLGRTLICTVKAGSLRSTIKVLEPIEQSIRGSNDPTFQKPPQRGNDTLKVVKEFYMPNEALSIHFLKTKLCVACTTGFEIVDLKSLDTQPLLDPADLSLNSVPFRDDIRPLSIYRIGGEFLLCYTEFAFFVNKSGWRSKKDIMIHWEGTPTAFALHYPYVMAIDSKFIEIWNVEKVALAQVIRGSNLRLLFADVQPPVKNLTSRVAPVIQERGNIILKVDHGMMAVSLAKSPCPWDAPTTKT